VSALVWESEMLEKPELETKSDILPPTPQLWLQTVVKVYYLYKRTYRIFTLAGKDKMVRRGEV